MPELFVEGAGAFSPTQFSSTAVRARPGCRPSRSRDRAVHQRFSSGSSTLLATGDEGAATVSGERLAAPAASHAAPLIDLSATGAAVATWRELAGGRGVVGVQERRADGVIELSQLTAPRGGSVDGLALGGSSAATRIVAFHQGGASSGRSPRPWSTRHPTSS